MRKIDLTNQIFGEWQPLYYAGNKKWHCKCLHDGCNVERDVSTQSLISGRSTSCGNHSTVSKQTFIDITNMQFHELKALKYLGNRQWLCECSCGKQIIADSRKLRNGSTKSCGHDKISIKADLTNMQFNDWTVLEYLGDSYWKCQCSCGNIAKIKAYELTSGRSKSCGHKSRRGTYDNKAGDWTVLELSEGYARCKCKCGEEKTFSDSMLWYYRKNNYKCKHNNLIGKQLGLLHVDRRLDNGKYECTCKCGNTCEISRQNLVSGNVRSCGCLRNQNLYSKDDVVSFINKFESEKGFKPFVKNIADGLNIGMTTAYGYIDEYGLNTLISRHQSIAEKEIAAMFKDAIMHDRTILTGRELDIYIPSKRIAIEFNGTYWHSTECKDKNYHQQKTIACAKLGVRLIHIFEYEWLDDVQKEKIITLLGKINNSNTDVIYARNCIVKEIDIQEVKDFANKYHMQNHTNASIYLGIYYNNQLDGIMTFGTPRYDKKYQYEIIRLCFKNIIVGGSEKIFKYFLREYNPNSIITYVNISKFTGNVYTKLGFNPIIPNPITQPNYVWVEGHNKEVLTRYQTQKQKLIEKGLGKAEQTEDEIMKNLGYYKIYDSGNLKLEWIK